MRIIKRLKRAQQKIKDDKPYTLYTYQVIDEYGNSDDVDSLQEFKLGTRVEMWHDAKYNKVKMREYRSKR